MTNYLSQSEHRRLKSRLTRKRNAFVKAEYGSREKLLAARALWAETIYAFTVWDAGDYAYPDSWHSWQSAKIDAARYVQSHPYDDEGPLPKW